MEKLSSFCRFLFFIIFITSCMEKDQPLASDNHKYPLTLNPNEQKLFGEWQLQSMSTKDTVFNDKAFMTGKGIHFTDWTYANQQSPIAEDHQTGLSLNATPDRVIYEEVFYKANDPFTIIFYKNLQDTIHYHIVTIAIKELVIEEPISGNKWKFAR